MVNAKKLGLLGRCLLGAGAVLGTAGCEETLSEGDLFSAAMQGYGMRSGTVEGMQSAAVLGQLGKTAADRQHELRVAREGKTEVNVNVGENLPVDYMIVTNSGTGESKIVPGNDWWGYLKLHKSEYPEGCIINEYHNNKNIATVRSK